ncbi:hypothetical protein SERLADRAFT_438574, partial [Serpula lacrymans var. lacrymans S7.9]
MALQTRPEPMNASPYHSKVKVSLILSDPTFVAGSNVSGKMELECRADMDSGLGIGVIMVELFAIQEITARDHSATSTFIHTRRLFQGPNLPPSNAVLTEHEVQLDPSDPPLPTHHYPARRGLTTFFFRFPIPPTSPSSIAFGDASIRYEVRASVGVAWRGEKRVVTDKKDVSIVEGWEASLTRAVHPEGVVLADGGRMWVQARVVGGIVVAGESVCVELQLKNHSQKTTTGVTLTLTRTLHLSHPPPDKPHLGTSETLTSVAFITSDYIVPPGSEGVAHLVVDVPRTARGARGGVRVGGDSEDGTGRRVEGKGVSLTDALFEVRCVLSVKVEMPLGTQPIILDLPVTIFHPLAAPIAPLPLSPPQFTSPPPEQAYYPPGLPYPISETGYPIMESNYLGERAYAHALSPPPISSLSPVPYPPHTHQMYANPTPGWTSPQHADYNYHPYPNPTVDPSVQYQHHQAFPPYPVPLSPHYAHGQLSPPGQPYLSPGLSPIDSLSGGASPAANSNQAISDHDIPFSEPLPGPLPQSAQPYQSPISASLSITIPPLPNPHDTQGVIHSPRPAPSPKHSTHTVSIPVALPAVDTSTSIANADSHTSNTNVSTSPHSHAYAYAYTTEATKSSRVRALEKMADDVARKSQDLSGDLPKAQVNGGDNTGVDALSGKEEEKEGKEKTLPSPPVPSTKDRLLALSGRRPRVDDIFSAPEADADASTTPPTPPLAAITPVKFTRLAPTMTMTEMTSGLGAGAGKQKATALTVPEESGLDALERRLLAEVGTRKLERDTMRPDARAVVHPTARAAVMPITIPPSTNGVLVEGVNDSAISSLTLAGGKSSEEKGGMGFGLGDRRGWESELEHEHEYENENEQDRDSDERTQQPGGRFSEDGKDVQGRRRKSHEYFDRAADKFQDRSGNKDKDKDKDRDSSGDTDIQKRTGRRKFRELEKGPKGEEVHKLRKEAKGRIAAWLGQIDPAVPPPAVDDSSPMPSPSVSHFVPIVAKESFPPPPLTPVTAVEKPVGADQGGVQKEDVSASPNPRSSGFVPIATLKMTATPTSADKSSTRSPVEAMAKMGPPASHHTHTKKPSPTLPFAPPKSNKSPDPPPAADKRPVPTKQPANANAFLSPSHHRGLSPRLPRFPAQPPDPEVKYDIRSARGGRGGK